MPLSRRWSAAGSRRCARASREARPARRRSASCCSNGADERWDAMTEVLLLNAARRDHVVRLIRPALERGLWVVSDRFLDSTIAYQGYGRGVALAELMAAHRLAVGDFLPDLTLILDLPVAEGLARAARRGARRRPLRAARPCVSRAAARRISGDRRRGSRPLRADRCRRRYRERRPRRDRGGTAAARGPAR